MTERLSWLQKEHDVQYFGASMAFGSMKHEQVLHSMELFAKEVMPKFK